MSDTLEIPRVLVADDQPAILEALRFLFGKTDFDLDLVTSMDTVRQRVAAARYDLLLMDLNYARDTTSGREGLDLLTEIHDLDRGLPIVVMTGWGNVDTAVDAMRRGARSFVQKPWDNSALLDVVTREVIEGRRSRRADVRARYEQDEVTRIQRALLPAALPSIDACDLAAIWRPAEGLGGDCYDALRFGDSRVGLAIADVIGKGLPAALLMANLQASVRALASAGAMPRDVVSGVNRLLCGSVTAGKFVTFCYLVLDTTTSQIVFSNAGHNPPMLVHADGSIDRLDPSGMVLGVLPDGVYEQAAMDVRPGDRLVLFTDGIVEAQRLDGEQFGDDRLFETIVERRCESAQGLVDAILDAVTAFTGGGFQDDATLVSVAIN
jgi:sigma-B regulation protein RsbU (phosphoserine phosphatase)